MKGKDNNKGGLQFGKLLKGLREKNGMRAKELATRIGVSQPAVTQWEQGKRNPEDERTLARLLEVLEASDEERNQILASCGYDGDLITVPAGVDLLDWINGKLDRIAALGSETAEQLNDLRQLIKQHQVVSTLPNPAVIDHVVPREQTVESAASVTEDDRSRGAVERYEEAVVRAGEKQVSGGHLSPEGGINMEPDEHLSRFDGSSALPESPKSFFVAKSDDASREIRDNLAEATMMLQARGGSQWWVKGGLPANSMPVDLPWYEESFRRHFNGAEAESVLQTRIARIHHALNGLEEGKDYRFIIPRWAIERYVRDGIPNCDEYEATDPTWIAEPRERIARIRKLISLLTTFENNYHIALSDQESSEHWWGIYDNRTILLESCGDKRGQGCFSQEDPHPMIMQLHIDYYLSLWNAIPPVDKDNKEVIKWLEGLLRVC